MKKRLGRTWLLGSLLLLLGSCGQRDPLAGLVPANALALFKTSALTDLTSYVALLQKYPALTPEELKGKSLPDLLGRVLRPFGLTAQDLDDTKPLALALVPNRNRPNPWEVWAYLPVKDGGKDREALEQRIPPSFFRSWAQSYLVIALQGDAAPMIPPDKPLDLALLSGYGPESQTFLLNFSSLSEKLRAQWTAVTVIAKTALRRALDINRTLSPDQEDAVMRTLGGLIDDLAEIRAISGSISLDDRGLIVKTVADFPPGSIAERALKEFKPTKGAMEFTRYWDQNSLLNGAWNWSGPANHDLSDALISFFGLQDQTRRAWNDAQTTLDEIRGARGSFSLDLIPQAALLQKALQSGNPAWDQVLKALGLRFWGVEETQNGDTLRKILTGLFRKGFFNEVVASVLRDNPLPLDVALEYSSTPDADPSKDSIRLKFKFPPLPFGIPQDKARILAQMKDNIDRINDLLKLDLVFQEKKVYWGFDPKPGSALATLKAQDRLDRNWSQSRVFQNLVAAFPDDSQVFFSASPWNWSEALRTLNPALPKWTPDDTEDAPGIIGYLRLGDGRAEAGGGLSLREFLSLLDLGRANGP